MMKFKAGFIGCGNMGGALARAIAKSVGGSQISLCDTDKNKLEALSQEIGAHQHSAEQIIKSSKFVFLAVKPQVMQDVLSPLKETINASNATIVTMAAGLDINYYESTINIKCPIIRIMPNTPCAVGEGMILYDCSSNVSAEVESEFVDILSEAGNVYYLKESLIDAGSAVSGCGPAFAYMFIEALADAGVECGLPRDTALLCAAQMLKGSAEMVLAGGKPAILKDNVCSPGGTTIAGVHALESYGFRAAAMNAVVAAYKRTLELK